MSRGGTDPGEDGGPEGQDPHGQDPYGQDPRGTDLRGRSGRGGQVRGVLLTSAAAGLVAATIWVQVAHGGGDFVPARSADPCIERPVTPVSAGIDGLSEQLVLLGLDGAACRAGVSREGFVLGLAEPGGPAAAEVEALRGGLHVAVDRLERAGRLPRASVLADEALEVSGLPDLVRRALGLIPDAVIDNRLATADVLRRTVDGLDLRRLLASLADPAEIQSLVRAAITTAVIDTLLDGLPNPLG